ncbi:hypothetical protein BUALT_Bualt06G0034400 [Buddleja alternifolia]|uniref:Agenet domain-containing protein n=1 Tax=Buddleja alternifolia TaxID=168488 RepID=A0AAV6XNA4_9LAMI|nr:hypothetical protein BUALT_Bualt06G0034400 [Buddleja alternifolia]
MGPLSPKPKIFKPISSSSPPCKRRLITPLMAFEAGDSIEVSSKEEGFLGSYYEATVVAKITRNNQYVVEYKNLVEDDDLTAPLREIVTADEVRPAPPPLGQPEIRYFYGDVVDAFDNDGWWVGRVTGMDVNQGKYCVYFEYFGVEIAYHPSKLRLHQDWKKGRWSLASEY